MSGPLQRVRQLVELAARSPYAEEARNAAVEACKLVKENGFVIVEAIAEEVVQTAPNRPRQKRAGFRPEASTLDLDALRRVIARGAGRGVGRVVEKGITDFFKGRRR